MVSRFNEVLTARLLEGALDTLTRHGARPKDIRVVHVPGAFEIPLALKRALARFRPDAALTLAVVIQGKTRHFDQVVQQSAKGVQAVILKTDIPVILGIIPAKTIQDAVERVGLKQENKGRDWALAAIEMADLMRRVA